MKWFKKISFIGLVMLGIIVVFVASCGKEANNPTTPIANTEIPETKEIQGSPESDDNINIVPLMANNMTQKYTPPARKGYIYTVIQYPIPSWTDTEKCVWVRIKFGSWDSGYKTSCAWSLLQNYGFVVRSYHRYADRASYSINTNGTIAKGPKQDDKPKEWDNPHYQRYEW